MTNTNKEPCSTFEQANATMIATNDQAWSQDSYYSQYRMRTKTYTPKEIEQIIESGSISEQIKLSKNYFQTNGFYKRLILHYATLPKYTGILIPSPSYGKDLTTEFIKKRYDKAVSFLERMKLESFFTSCSIKILTEGAYYGVIKEINKKNFAVIDLPVEYCRTRFKDYQNNDLVEFDIRYFDTIYDKETKKILLNSYPEVISNYYYQYKRGKNKDCWVFIPSDLGICFTFLGQQTLSPIFLNVIPATVNYDETISISKEREKDEIRKIIVQEIPHLNDGTLLFEPNEASEMHRGAVGMMKGNSNTSILTTYANVSAITSKTNVDTASSSLENAVDNIYNESGTSHQLFGTDSNLALEYSLDNDFSFMTPLLYKYQNFVTNIINSLFSNSNISFAYKILPITQYNATKYMESQLKNAQAGYSYLIPALAAGISQKELSNLKTLENDVLKLNEKLIPLSSSFNMSSSDKQSGAPKKEIGELSPKTEQNQASMS